MDNLFIQSQHPVVEELLTNKHFGDTLLVCANGHLTDNKLAVGLLFPALLTSDIFALPIENVLLVPDYTMEEIGREFEKLILGGSSSSLLGSSVTAANAGVVDSAINAGPPSVNQISTNNNGTAHKQIIHLPADAVRLSNSAINANVEPVITVVGQQTNTPQCESSRTNKPATDNVRKVVEENSAVTAGSSVVAGPTTATQCPGEFAYSSRRAVSSIHSFSTDQPHTPPVSAANDGSSAIETTHQPHLQPKPSLLSLAEANPPSPTNLVTPSTFIDLNAPPVLEAENRVVPSTVQSGQVVSTPDNFASFGYIFYTDTNEEEDDLKNEDNLVIDIDHSDIDQSEDVTVSNGYSDNCENIQISSQSDSSIEIYIENNHNNHPSIPPTIPQQPQLESIIENTQSSSPLKVKKSVSFKDPEPQVHNMRRRGGKKTKVEDRRV